MSIVKCANFQITMYRLFFGQSKDLTTNQESEITKTITLILAN